MSERGSWAYEDDFDSIVELSDAGIALHLLKSVFFLNGRSKRHWNSVKHPRDAHGRWAHTFDAGNPRGGEGLGERGSRVFGTSRETTIQTPAGSPNVNHTVNPGDRVYQTSSGSHVVVKPDGSGTYIGRDGKQIALSGKGVDGHLGKSGADGKGAPKLVDHQPGIQVHAKNDAEAEKILQQHEGIDKKYSEKHPSPENYKPRHSSAKEDTSSSVPDKSSSNDFSGMNLQPGDELRRNAKDNNITMIVHADGTSMTFDATSGKETNNTVNKTQGLLLGNADISDAIAGKKSWSSLDAKSISSAQKTLDQRWPVIHKEPMADATFSHSEHGDISAKHSDSKNIVAKEHPKGIAVRNTHTGSTLLHKKDGTVSKFSGSVNDFNALPSAVKKSNDSSAVQKANDSTHEHNTLGGTTPTNIGSNPDQKNSFRQQQQSTGHGVKQESLGGVDSAGNLKLPDGAGTSDTIVIENEAELNVIIKTFEQLGIKQINGIPLAEYFNIKGKK